MRTHAPQQDAPSVEFLIDERSTAASDVEAISFGVSSRYAQRLRRLVASTRVGRAAGALSGWLTARRRAFSILGGVMAAVVLAATFWHETGPVRASSPSPLRSVVCLTGHCRIDAATDAELAPVRVHLDSRYVLTGTRLTDRQGKLREITVIGTDGIRVVTLRAAQNSSPPKSWPSLALGIETVADGIHTLTIRSVLVSPRTHERWAVLVATTVADGSQATFGDARRLAADPLIVL